ncbi:MAG: RibD family protein [Sedimentisphaerales bacterium]|nr:RibD family protein [Sedimentisphaerales bacterium]
MKPRVIVYNAVSLDGRIDWFKPDMGLFYGLISGWNEDATLVGCDTALNPPEEMPAETESDFSPVDAAPDDARPILVIPDSRGRLKNWHFWKRLPYWRKTVALCSEKTAQEHLEYLERRHIDYIVCGADHVDYAIALERLNIQYKAKVVRVDSGGTLNGLLLRAGLVDEVHLLVHPCLVGGTTPKSFFRAPDLATGAGVMRLRLRSVEEQSEGIVLLSYEVVR